MIRVSLLVLLSVVYLMCSAPASAADEKWRGVDQTVVEKVAKEHGREARAPLINTDQGDLLPFFFLLAGVAGGFAAGYYWRKLTGDRGRSRGAKGGR